MAATRRLLLSAGLAMLTTGCAEHLRLRHEEPTVFWTGRLFWPPPTASSVWLGAPSLVLGPSLVDAAVQLADALDRGGYNDLRIVPIGLGYLHGFALATRLEKLGPAGSPAAPDRWSPSYPRPPELRWLAFATEPPMPSAGRFRTLLVSFTDLPLVDPHRPPVESEETVMDGPDVPTHVPLPHRRIGPRYRVSLHVYEFESERAGGTGPMVGEARVSEPAAKTAERLGL